MIGGVRRAAAACRACLLPACCRDAIVMLRTRTAYTFVAARCHFTRCSVLPRAPCPPGIPACTYVMRCCRAAVPACLPRWVRYRYRYRTLPSHAAPRCPLLPAARARCLRWVECHTVTASYVTCRYLRYVTTCRVLHTFCCLLFILRCRAILLFYLLRVIFCYLLRPYIRYRTRVHSGARCRRRCGVVRSW